MASHSSILAWRIPWIEETGGLLSTASQRVGHDLSYLAHMSTQLFQYHLLKNNKWLPLCSINLISQSFTSTGLDSGA